MFVLIKIILDLEETEQRDTDAVLDGEETVPENGPALSPQGAARSAGISRKAKTKTRDGDRKSNLYDFQNNLWMKWRCGAGISTPPPPSKLVHSKAGTFKYWIFQN